MSARVSAPGHGAAPPRKLLHLDPFSGIAGNMFLGALLDAGLPLRGLEAALAGLRLPHRLRVTRVRRGPLAARHVEVIVGGRAARRGRATHAAHPEPEAHLAHGHGPHAHGRPYDEIRRLLDRARLTPGVRDRAQAIFAGLAAAEARVHGIPLARVHFHEVGAVDAIVDIAGAAIALDQLGIARVTCAPVALGHGSVETAHGRLPLPAPAVLELLRGAPSVPAHVAWETVTPTGAAILREIVDEWRQLPALTLEAIGHGAGDDRPGPLPNVLRALIGREGGALRDSVCVLECQLDDLVPEHFDLALERLLAAGALDVMIQHAQMKKNRPGFALTVIAPRHARSALAELLLRETGSLGVRASEVERVLLPREIVRVATRFGTLRVKRAWDADGRARASAEYDDAKRAAQRYDVPIADVIRAAERAATESRGRRPR